MAIPVTVNVVLILSDCLLVWATAFKSRLLLLPWMAMHALEFGLFVALLVYLMIYLVEPWVKVTERQSLNTKWRYERILFSSQVVVFLIGCPVIILLGFFWFVVKCFHKYIGATEWKGVSVRHTTKHGIHRTYKVSVVLE